MHLFPTSRVPLPKPWHCEPLGVYLRARERERERARPIDLFQKLSFRLYYNYLALFIEETMPASPYREVSLE
jgi:hypothetical protein